MPAHEADHSANRRSGAAHARGKRIEATRHASAIAVGKPHDLRRNGHGQFERKLIEIGAAIALETVHELSARVQHQRAIAACHHAWGEEAGGCAALPAVLGAAQIEDGRTHEGEAGDQFREKAGLPCGGITQDTPRFGKIGADHSPDRDGPALAC
ncbi:hypothetical protein [Sphingomonas sp. CCH5-D11]|uniref:hypothetical protein n=1 Tax=Sphingomonas sp. CCH5-D11 TaxID=1768786 RepID=UPI001E5DBDDA|nr:hypothetical protein [Sphingomonas sp. CCH5-D11]